ncbi:DUF2442 domain-containing protein [Vibrio sp. JC009]|uniref:helix-turn-helix domain-containing transcriptional regulator n=1 Tax=Vibrio sp. JC009 TaxID=2912314 RepID=UPI0023AE7ECA|nr:transcriptional regulator [Vibrio sp. JC009]WED22064.1 DUF2442 domain-containing protein [Vibrio sp. JC009]
MLKIVDLDWLSGYLLELEFSDGFKGIVDLEEVFNSEPYKQIQDFSAFSLEGTYLDWDGVELSANILRKMAAGKGHYTDRPCVSASNMEDVLKQAAWDAIVSNRPDIFQAAIKGFVEEYGIQKIQQHTNLKSRPSIYKALSSNKSPKLDTLIQLGHAAFELEFESREISQKG